MPGSTIVRLGDDDGHLDEGVTLDVQAGFAVDQGSSEFSRPTMLVRLFHTVGWVAKGGHYYTGRSFHVR